jgi:hypothetical protein
MAAARICRPRLTTRLRDHAAAPCGAVHLAEELSMSPLHRRMIEDMQIRKLAPHTQRAYVELVIRFPAIFANRPEHLGPG